MIAFDQNTPLYKRIAESLSSFVPGSKRLRGDLFFILFVMWLQHSFLRGAVFHNFFIDLATPLVTLYSIRSSLRKALTVALTVAFIVETHSAAPFGLFISTFWIIAVSINKIKPHISWRFKSSWVYIFTLSQLFCMIMVLLTFYLRSATPSVTLQTSGNMIFQLLFTMSLVQLLPKKWTQEEFGDEKSW